MNKAACLLLLLLFSFSCRHSKENLKSKRSLTVDEIIKDIETGRNDFEYFAARMKINYEDSKQSRSFTANIRLQKDSIIWISVTTLLGIEAARIMIIDDSVHFLNRFKKEYKKSSLKLLEDYIPFQFNIALLQNILVGNPILPPSANTKVKKNKKHITLVSEDKSMNHSVALDSDTYTISTEQLVDKQNNRSVSLIFEEYQKDEMRLFSHERDMSFKGEDDVKLGLKFSKVKWNEPQEFPFYVSDKYE